MIVLSGILRSAAVLRSTRVHYYRHCSRLFCSEQKRQQKAARKAQEKAEKEAARLTSGTDQVRADVSCTVVLLQPSRLSELISR